LTDKKRPPRDDTRSIKIQGVNTLIAPYKIGMDKFFVPTDNKLERREFNPKRRIVILFRNKSRVVWDKVSKRRSVYLTFSVVAGEPHS
jgi:hypothetical protein